MGCCQSSQEPSAPTEDTETEEEILAERRECYKFVVEYRKLNGYPMVY